MISYLFFINNFKNKMLNFFNLFNANKPKLTFKRICINAKIPFKADPGCAGYDIFSTEPVSIYPGTRKLVATGLCSEFSEKYYLRIAPRSGLSVNGIDIGAGVIDSSYRGQIKVLMINNSDITQQFPEGFKIAQLIMESCETPEIIVGETLTDSSRGKNGFGSTGN